MHASPGRPELPELPELIDSHCHLHYEYPGKTVDDLVREAREQGIATLVTIGTDLDSFRPVRELSERFDCVYHTIGVHPHEVATLQDADLSRIEEAARHPRCRAIGEIGLDYHYDHSPREQQREWLGRQLGLAAKLGLPVVIHSRDGEKDLLTALTEYRASLPAPGGEANPGVIHCFTGTQAFGQACIELGFYISLSGILTFKNAEDLRACARAFPLERLLVETDSPYLAPIPFRGRKCEPSMVRFTAQKLAEIRGVPIEEVARVTTANARRLFRLSSLAS